MAVAFPRSSADIVRALEVCRQAQVPVTLRGGGTSIAGNAVGSGVVIDCSRHLNAIGEVDAESKTVRVQPGVVLDDLQAAAAPYGLRFGPDPSTHSRATIGGMIGNNACGSRAMRYGRTSDNVAGLDVLTGSGELLSIAAGSPPQSSAVLAGLDKLVSANLAPIRTEFGRCSRQASGYSLEHLLPERNFDVARFLVGSEGSLAVVLGATLRLVDIPRHTRLVVLGYPDLPSAADDVPGIRGCRPVAVEGLDSRIVDIVRRQPGAVIPDLPRGDAWLFVELAGATPGELDTAAGLLLSDSHPLDHRVVSSRAEASRLWRIREDGAGLASRPTRERMFFAGWEDAAVPPERLGAYLREFGELVSQYGLSGYPYGHMGDGCVHVRLDFALGERDGTRRFREFLLDAAGLVARHGGSMSGEHGDGRARSELLPRMYSGRAIGLFSQVKDIFDPAGILNPGIIARPAPVDADLRAAGSGQQAVPLAFAYTEDGGDFGRAVHRCSGVGRCRSGSVTGDDVMCPSYMASRDEKDSTRGRARVLQELVRADGSFGWRSPEVRDALDLCLACKGCASDCPTGTDMARYKSEVLHQAYKGRVRPLTHYSLGRLPTWTRLAASAPRLVNAVLGSGAGTLLKAAAGVDRRRVLPTFAGDTFRRMFARRGSAQHGTPVALWVDTFTEYFQPEIGMAAVQVLEDAGYAVTTIPGRACCGLTYLSTGQLGKASRRLDHTLDLLDAAAHDGTPVVGLEPSCVSMVRGEATDLLGRSPKSLLTLAELLSRTPGYQPALGGVTVLAQPHCHQRAVLDWDLERSYLAGHGAAVADVPGCCGLAGNFGMERGHFELSMAVAATALAPAVKAAGGDEVLLADGFSCRLQISQLGAGPALHTAQLLARHGHGQDRPAR